MKRRALLALAGGAAAWPLHAPAQGVPPVVRDVKNLGNDRVQVGPLLVDRKARRVTVPARIHALDKPLEFLATTPNGRKAYESLLALDTTGSELNLACILVGLERDPEVPSSKPLDPAQGRRVQLSVAWGEGAARRVLPALEALLGAEAAAAAGPVGWVYTGSFTSRDGSLLAADQSGTLVSFVKPDRSAVIEAVSIEKVGPYGAVRGAPGLPPEGTAVELLIDAGPAAK